MAKRMIENPANRFDETCIEWDPEALNQEAPNLTYRVLEDDSKTIIASNNSPDIPFSYSLNPYRGCMHGCIYCYARTTHETVGLSAGTDFETIIFVKKKAPLLLDRAFRRPSWRGDLLAFSGVTDCYQPLEQRFELTRQCLQVCLSFRNPVGIITRSTLILRDVELLAELHRAASATVTVSIPFDDDKLARAIEPLAPPPSRRYAIIEGLAKAGVPVGVNVSPLIPGLNVQAIPAILERARQAGASFCSTTLLRLPGSVGVYFEKRLREVVDAPVADKVLRRWAAMRSEQERPTDFGERMRGGGAQWQLAMDLFLLHKKRLGYAERKPLRATSSFRVPAQGRQLGLFDGAC